MITFDTAEATNFLTQVFGDIPTGRIGISAIHHSGKIWNKHFQWISHPETGAVARAALWNKSQPQGIFFRCTMLPPQGVVSGRGEEEDSHALSFFWADLDYGTVGHKPAKDKKLPPDEEAALGLIDGIPTPTMIIHSGGGLYPIWQFDRPIYITDANRAEVKARSEGLQKIIERRSAEFGWDYGAGVGNLDRILRLPGSTNRKKAPDGTPLERPCRVIEQTGQVFPW